jgi:hypothetical protein
MVTRPLFSEWNLLVLHPLGYYDVCDVLQNHALRKTVISSSSGRSLNMKTESNTILRIVEIYLPKTRSNRWKYLKPRTGFITPSVGYHLVVCLNIFGTKSQTEPAYKIKPKSVTSNMEVARLRTQILQQHRHI